jgi:hypothetical protein
VTQENKVPHNMNQEVQTIVLTIRRPITSHGYFFTVLSSTRPTNNAKHKVWFSQLSILIKME